MATWTNIQTARLEPGKPIRSIDGIALRDNPIAIAEGASGAPRIVAGALASNSVQTAKIVNSAVTTAKIANSNVTAAKLATGGAENNWVRARMATSTAGQVGTYAFVYRVTRSNSTGPQEWNSTVAGSTLRPASSMFTGPAGNPWTMPPLPGQQDAYVDARSNSLSGTWRIMGYVTGRTDNGPNGATLALRIS